MSSLSGKQKLKQLVIADASLKGANRWPGMYWEKYHWILDRAQHYADKTGISSDEIVDSWERDRTNSHNYMYYYQDKNQPEIKGDNVRIFDTLEELFASVGDDGFRCPVCQRVSENPYHCSHKTCDWKIWLFRRNSTGTIHIFVKKGVIFERIFMPIKWENQTHIIEQTLKEI